MLVGAFVGTTDVETGATNWSWSLSCRRLVGFFRSFPTSGGSQYIRPDVKMLLTVASQVHDVQFLVLFVPLLRTATAMRSARTIDAYFFSRQEDFWSSSSVNDDPNFLAC